MGPSAYWYLTRGTGTVSLVLLTVSVALGLASVLRVRPGNAPRFVLGAIHRNASLLAVAFLVVHIAMAVLDTFAPIRLIDAVVPFVGAYRPVWLGLGTVGFDLMLALVITSLLRRRIGLGTWRATHWLAYACWPVALVHGLGTGSDVHSKWMLALVAICLLSVLGGLLFRIRAGWPDHLQVRGSAAVAACAGLLALLVWLPVGPLAAGWARRAGTPAALLRVNGGQALAARGGSASGSASLAAFTATASGNVAQSSLPGGLVRIELKLALSGNALNTLYIRIDGRALGGGGVSMLSSSVTLGSTAQPARYRGRVTALAGTNVQARLVGAGARLGLLAQLQIDPGAGTAAGSVSVQPGG